MKTNIYQTQFLPIETKCKIYDILKKHKVPQYVINYIFDNEIKRLESIISEYECNILVDIIKSLQAIKNKKPNKFKVK